VIGLIRRYQSLDGAGRRLVIEAAFLMAFVWLGLRIVHYARLRRVLDRYAAARSTRVPPGATERIRRAIAAVARGRPSATCLVQALAADVMLRRRGVACELCIGVRILPDTRMPLEAHAWVECDGAVAVGAIEHLSTFHVLTPARRLP